jgi:molybdopterin-containing oxidoreductase family membrane subunit
MGGPSRVFNLFLSPQWNSPLIWDVFVILLYFIINVVYLVLMSAPKQNERALKITSAFALPIAILVHSITAWIFGLEIAKEGWYSALMAPMCVVSAVDSGLALLLIVLAALNKLGILELGKKLMASLTGLLATVIAIDAFLIFCEVLTMAYPGGSAAEILGLMLTGQTAFLFWGEVFCLVVPFLILVSAANREKTGPVILASALVVCGVLLKRLWLLLSSFIIFNTAGAPGVSVGNGNIGDSVWLAQGVYMPTIVELTISIGIISLAALAYLLLANRLLRPTAKAESDSTVDAAAVATAL